MCKILLMSFSILHGCQFVFLSAQKILNKQVCWFSGRLLQNSLNPAFYTFLQSNQSPYTLNQLYTTIFLYICTYIHNIYIYFFFLSQWMYIKSGSDLVISLQWRVDCR